MKRRMLRSLFAYVLFTALFAGGCALAVTTSAAQESTKPEEKPAGEDKPKAPTQPWVDNRPAGPDELFSPLPVEGMAEGKAPAMFHKAVILDVPFSDSWNDDPIADLPRGCQLGARALRYSLEQRLDYLPNVYLFLPQSDTGAYMRRVARYQARLRFAADFAPGKAAPPGTKSQALETAARDFGADIVFAMAYSPGDVPRALCVRYRRGSGVETTHEFGLQPPEGKSLVSVLDQAATQACAGLATTIGADGKPAELPVAPVPPIAGSDAALRRCVNLRQALESSSLRKGWVEFEDLKKLEAPGGRAATWAMEVFRGLADSGSAASERDTYVALCLNTAREGLRQAPNDVLLRGKMCRYASIWFKRDAWALDGIRQALRVQPANAHLLDWHGTIEFAADRAKQADWLHKVAVPLLPDSRGPFLLASCYFQDGRYADGVAHYLKAVALSPNEHEYRFALGLCATYLAEQLERTDRPGADGKSDREKALDAFATAAESLVAAQRLNPSELGWAYDYHPRAATRSFTSLPTNPDTLERVMLSQAVATTLLPTSRTEKWDRLVAPLIGTYRRLLRGLAREADPAGPDYEIWLMARLQFALADKDLAEGNRDEIVATLRLMRRFGHRSDLYTGAMAVYGVLLD